MTAQMPEVPAYSHSLKLEETAKGLRISCHVYAMNSAEAIEQAFQTYLHAKMKAIENHVPLAPVDSK